MFCFTTSKSQTIHSSIQEQACYAGRLPSPSHPIVSTSRQLARVVAVTSAAAGDALRPPRQAADVGATAAAPRQPRRQAGGANAA